MSEILKPCPFCGGKAIVDSEPVPLYLRTKQDPDGEYAPVAWWCVCEKCGAESTYQKSELKAIEAWNRRTLNAQGMTAKEALKIGEEIYKGIQAGIASVHGDTNNRKEG